MRVTRTPGICNQIIITITLIVLLRKNVIFFFLGWTNYLKSIPHILVYITYITIYMNVYLFTSNREHTL